MLHRISWWVDRHSDGLILACGLLQVLFSLIVGLIMVNMYVNGNAEGALVLGLMAWGPMLALNLRRGN